MPTGLLQPYFAAYDCDYYSASQCGVYIGDILIDEVVRIGWSHVHTKTPVFSYASRYFETVAWGQEIVQGSLAINFKEAAYLQLVLMQYEHGHSGCSPVKLKDGTGSHGETKTDRINNFALTARNNIEMILRDQQLVDRLGADNVNNEDETVDSEFSILEQIYGFADLLNQDDVLKIDDSLRYTTRDFEQLAEKCENTIWGNSSLGSEGTMVNEENLVVPTHSNPFNIYLTYGDYSNDYANHTGKKITEVHLTSQGQTISLDGQPIFEIYDFIARGVDLAGGLV